MAQACRSQQTVGQAEYLPGGSAARQGDFSRKRDHVLMVTRLPGTIPRRVISSQIISVTVVSAQIG
jgi:hypothetical protein